MTRKAKAKKNARGANDIPRFSFSALHFTLKAYREAAGPKRWFLSLYRIYTAIITAVTPVIAGKAITQISEAVGTHDFMPFLGSAILLLVLQLVNIVLSGLNSLISETVHQDTYVHISELIARKYIEIPLRVRESREFADKFERVREFGSNISLLSTFVSEIISSIISLISIVIATITVSPVVTILVVVAAIPYSILSLKLSARRRRNWRYFTKDRRIAWAIERKITNSDSALEIELNGLSHQFIDRMVKARRHSEEQDLADSRRFFLPSLASRASDSIVSYFLLGYVGFEIIYGRLAIGQFSTVRSLLLQLNNSVTSLFNSIANANEGFVNAADFMEFMSAEAQSTGSIPVTDIPKIEFRNVSFTYPHSDHKALDGINFVLNPGDSMAIVGENGAGKTTMIKLLIGAYKPSEGEILVNDIPLDQIDRVSYLAQIGALFQDFSRYEFANLGENVWFGDVTRPFGKSAIEAAIADAGLSALYATFPHGLKQNLSKDIDDQNATDLSGGQWQRVGIARAFFRSPNVLLLDEPTSAVDAKSEYEIFRNIIRNQKGKSTIIISHRFSTVRKAESIIVVDHGKIVERGTHDELIAQNGLYKEMFDLQAEGYI